jgi:addiction module RelE/StbE family toxin
MWRVLEHRRVEKQLRGKIPIEVRERYEKWREIAYFHGPAGLAGIPGFHDESLLGKWVGHRSSRLGLKWRVIYQVFDDLLLIQVVEVTAHDYKKR